MLTKQHFAIREDSGAFQVLENLFQAISIATIGEVLTKNLLAGIGFDKHIATQTAREVSDHVFNMSDIRRFLRRMPVELADIVINGDEPLIAIQVAFNNFDYDEAELIFDQDLAYFIYQVGDEAGDATIANIADTSAVYKEALDLIKVCFHYYQAMPNNKETKSPA